MPLTVVLDGGLKAETPRSPTTVEFSKWLLDYKERDQMKLLRASMPGEVRHRNYLDYLKTAWSNHQGVVLTPDIFWYTLLCESAAIIAADVEPYRKFFTDAPGKTTITIQTHDPTHLPINELIETLRRKVPGGLAKHFLPEFSTTDESAREARNAAFADAVSPYYDYETMLCGIPAVRIMGTVSDWQEIKICWMALTDVFITAREYCTRVQGVIGKVIMQFALPDPAFLKDIFIHERCGSGHDYRPSGWFADLFRKQPRDSREFAPHIAKVNYKNIETDRKFQSLHGVFGSSIKDGFMEPMFGKIVFEKTEGRKTATR